MKTISRQVMPDMFGPTTDDRLRLADTELFLEIEKRFHHLAKRSNLVVVKLFVMVWGQETKLFSAECVDVLITNTHYFRLLGHCKADIGIKDGRIVGIVAAGNPDVQPNVDIVIGPGNRSCRWRR